MKRNLNLFSVGIFVLIALLTLFVGSQVVTQVQLTRSRAASDSIVRGGTLTGSSTDSKQITTSSSVVAQANQLYVASISIKPNVEVTGVTGLGLNWTKAGAQCGGRSANRTEVWYAYGSPTVSEKVTAQLNKVPKAGVIAVTSYSGVNPTNPISGVVTKNSLGLGDTKCEGGKDADKFSINITPSANAFVFSAASIRHYSFNAGSGFSEITELKTSRGGGDDAGIAISDRKAISNNQINVAGSTSSDTDYAFIAMLINPSGIGSVNPTPTTPTSTTPSATIKPGTTAVPTVKPTVAPTIRPTASAAATVKPTPTSAPIGGNPPILPPVAETDSRITCAKYPERRIFVETQAWWMDSASVNTPSQFPLDGIGGHTHTATCFPEDQLITGGTMNFDVRLMLHKGNIGRVHWLDVGVGPGGSSIARVSFNTPVTCPGGSDPKVMCEVWVPISVDTSKIPSGYQELRFRFNVEQPNGERQFASTGWQAYYRTRTGGYRSAPWLEARGWYTGANYANARFLSPIPYEPVSGVWTFNVAMVPGSGGVRVTHHGVHVDARFNLDSFGWTIKDGSGPFTGSISIDTTKLTNGRHYLAIKADQALSNGGTNTGILQLPFIVQN